jgi:tetratricopeptide (TPR) repeat protein
MLSKSKNYEGRIMTITNDSWGTRTVAACAVLLLLTACGQKEEAASVPAAAAPQEATPVEVPVTTASEEARALFIEGRALLDGLHRVEAHQKFLQALEADPNFAMGHVLAANTSLSAAEFFDHVASAKAAAASASKGEKLYIEALVAASENNQAAQEAALKELVSMFPGDARTHMALGNFLNGQQDFAGAAEHFTHATEIAPTFASAFNSLGYAYRSLDDLDQAKAAFEKYVGLVPNEANPHDSIGELLMEMGDYEESLKQYQAALDIDPHFASSYAGLSINYSLLDQPEKAQQAAKQMLAAARNFAERQNAMFQSVTAYVFAGDHDSAIEVANKMAADANEQGDHAAAAGVYVYMGDIMLETDNPSKAEEHYGVALAHRQDASINEANKEQARRNHLFKTALAAMVAQDAEAAAERVASYTAAAEQAGTAFERRRMHELAGYMAMINDDMAAGVEQLSQASQLNPHVLYWSAVAQNALGNKDKAIELATRAANRNTLSPNLPFVRADALALLENLNET